MPDKIWLSSPHMSGNELKYVHEAFETNWVAPLGPNVEGMEADIESFLKENVKVAALSSGTAALHLALIQCGVTKGDEVLCQSMTFSASANPILYQGATPIFVDSEEDTWNMDPKYLEIAIEDRLVRGRKPKAIIIVHLYGMPAKMDEILEIASRYDIPVIEDAAEALGSCYKGKACGTFGTFGVLSFNGNKIITTSGGGALVCPTESDKKNTVFLSTQARDPAPHYQHSQVGYNYRMSNICAGIGRGQMEVLSERVKARREINKTYQKLFAKFSGTKVFSEPTADFYSNHWLSAILIDPVISLKTKDQLRIYLEERNIESRPLWKPMHLQPLFSEFPYYGQHNAESMFENGLCLPSGSNLTDVDMLRIADALQSFFTK